MSGKRTTLIAAGLIACGLLLTAPTDAPAEQRYIVDNIVVSLRQGPGPQYKVLKTLQTGQSFEVLETKGGFSRVRTSDGAEGWVQEQFTSPNPPNENVKLINELNETIKKLKAENEELLKASSTGGGGVAASDGDSATVQDLRAALAASNQRYQQLEGEAQDVVSLKTEKESSQAQAAAAQVTVVRLTAENQALRKRQTILWFLAGAGVLLLGWLIGRAPSRRQRHSLTL
ncbi:MAG: TIGR04211 family SH3 domain-containing protein [Desulfobacteraceae bacterium]|nr:TIGR04211 family SH3 domain-containing protein [Desulfobacteraceae bacterium]